MTASLAWSKINLVRRCKLYIRLAPVAFFIGVVSTPAGRPTVREIKAFLREQSDGNCANNFFPC